MSAPEEPARPEARLPEPRIGDREREQAVTHLGTAFAEGRLDLVEYDERVASAYGAKTASDLLHLTADLPLATREHPAQPAAATASKPQRRTRSRVAGGNREGTHVAYPGWLRALWLTYAAAVSINLVIWLIVSVSTADLVHFWPIWVAGPWGVILAFRTLAYRMGPASSRTDQGDPRPT
jgi:hypothetical protein